jgi:hypothetical protein
MPQILDRGEGNAKRRERLARQKKGPGVFVYNGKAFDTEWHPTPLLVGKDEPVLDSGGYPVLDSSGRQVFKPAGQYKRDSKGHIVMGGVPRVEAKPLPVFVVRGIEFPAGKKVAVDDPSLALKLRCLGMFDEAEADEADDEIPAHIAADALKKRPGRKPKAQATAVQLEAPSAED